MSEAEDILRELSNIEVQIKITDKERIEIIRRLQKLKSREEELKNKYSILKSQEVSNINWADNEYEWHGRINKILLGTFKLPKFRHQQLAAINALLSGKDVILLMPTGGGKSLCYQLPALVTKGITVVVSPLLSLIDDQIISLKKLGVNAVAINSSNSKTEGKKVYDALLNGSSTLKLIYVTPEWMAKSKRFMNALQKCHSKKSLDRIAIDEVHCCSQWGHDFRPDYKFLGILKNIFKDVPIIGLTATATEAVVVDCQKMLNIQGCVILKASYNRPNLYYEVKTKPSTQEKCLDLLADMILNKYKGQSGIIYTTTINDSVDLAKDLKSKGVSIACYHANMEPEIRQKIHSKWLTNQYQVVVATVAFGMGIDKPDVRFVIHHSMPKSMANFYQESGRAGRDDQRSDCILLYSFKDVFRNSSMICTTQTGTENLYKLVEYCIDVKTCRRSIIATHFDDIWDENDCNKMCDHCLRPDFYETIDITKYCKDLCSIIDFAETSETRLTAIKLLDAWFKTGGSKLVRVSHIDKPSVSREFGESIIIYLMVNKYLKEDIHFTPYSTISYLSRGSKSDSDKKIFMNVARTTQHRKMTNSEQSSVSSKESKRKNSEKYPILTKKSKKQNTECIVLD